MPKLVVIVEIDDDLPIKRQKEVARGVQFELNAIAKNGVGARVNMCHNLGSHKLENLPFLSEWLKCADWLTR